MSHTFVTILNGPYNKYLLVGTNFFVATTTLQSEEHTPFAKVKHRHNEL